MTVETRNQRTECEVREGANGPMIVGYASVFNRDSEDMGFIEQVDPGAFTKTLQEADVRALANHEPDWTLGRSKNGTLRLVTDSVGLRYEIDINPADPDGQRALAKVQRGDWDGSSFSFATIRDEWNWQARPPQRRLLEVALVDVGPVCFPAYPDSTAAARALSRIADSTGHSVDKLVTALRSGEIRSLIDKTPTAGEDEVSYRFHTRPVVASRAMYDQAEISDEIDTGEEDGSRENMTAMVGAVVKAYYAKLDELGLSESESGFSLCPVADQDGDADGDGVTLWQVCDEIGCWYVSAGGDQATVVGWSSWWRSAEPEAEPRLEVELLMQEQRDRDFRVAALAAA